MMRPRRHPAAGALLCHTPELFPEERRYPASVTLSRQKNELYQFCITILNSNYYKSFQLKIYYQFVRKNIINYRAKISQLARKATSIPKPFERDIFLFDTHVAGTTHVEGIEELEPQLKLDERLDFFREPNNPYDKQAIVIKTGNGVKIGYVPKQDNIVFSRLMDAGKLLFGRISGKEKNILLQKML